MALKARLSLDPVVGDAELMSEGDPQGSFLSSASEETASPPA